MQKIIIVNVATLPNTSKFHISGHCPHAHQLTNKESSESYRMAKENQHFETP